MAQLIGAAATLVARRRGIAALGDRPPMVSVTNVDPERIAALLDEFAQDLRTVRPPVLSNSSGRRGVVLAGPPSSWRVSSCTSRHGDAEAADPPRTGARIQAFSRRYRAVT